MVRQTQRSGKRIMTAVVLSLGLIAASCGKKDNGNATNVTTGGTTASTEAPTGGTEATGAPETSVAETTPPETTPAVAVTPGGEITVSGEAEVTNPWIPAAM